MRNMWNVPAVFHTLMQTLIQTHVKIFCDYSIFKIIPMHMFFVLFFSYETSIVEIHSSQSANLPYLPLWGARVTN